MKSSDIKLKNLKTFKGHDGTGINADVYIYGKKCFSVFDAAYGGELEIEYQDYDKVLGKERAGDYINQLLEFLGLPLDQLALREYKTGKEINSLEDYVNVLITDSLKEKEQKRFDKQCIDSICFGIPDSYSYSRITYRKPLADFPKDALQMIVNNIKKSDCKDGVVILNKNLSELGIKV